MAKVAVLLVVVVGPVGACGTWLTPAWWKRHIEETSAPLRKHYLLDCISGLNLITRVLIFWTLVVMANQSPGLVYFRLQNAHAEH